MKKAAAILILCIELLCLTGRVSANDIDAVRAQVFAWSEAWQNRDIDTYMSFYSPRFQSKGLDFKKWREKKATVFEHAGSIQVEISDLWVFIEGKQAVASFMQRYSHPSIEDIGEKTLVMVKDGFKWQIVSEEWKPWVISGRWDHSAKEAETVAKRNTKSQAETVNLSELNTEARAETENISNTSSQKINQEEQRVGNQEAGAGATEAKNTVELNIRPQAEAKNVAEFNTKNKQAPQKQQGLETETSSTVKTVVKSIRFEIEKEWEKVFIDLNQYAIPNVQTLEGEKPRIVLDFMNADSWRGPFRIPVNGRLVRQVRAYFHHKVGKLRIVLDLNSAEDYKVDQTFYKAENIYCITVQ